jgi:hypothetical protein
MDEVYELAIRSWEGRRGHSRQASRSFKGDLNKLVANMPLEAASLAKDSTLSMFVVIFDIL